MLKQLEKYIDKLKTLGFEVLNESRWLNAVSINCHKNDFLILSSLKFVKKIEPVYLTKRKKRSGPGPTVVQ